MITGCPFCKARGAHPVRYGVVCPVCLGAGQISVPDKTISCAFCSGRGVHPTKYGEFCPACQGKAVIPLAQLEPTPVSTGKPGTPPMAIHAAMSEHGSVFIVHGRNHTVRDKIDLFLTKDLGLKTVVMEAGPFGGRTLPEKFEDLARSCAFAIFILSADDSLVDKTTGTEIRRARQNVILEIGFFWGAFGRRGRVAFLVENDPRMELPSDIQGMGWIPITADLAETKMRLDAELRTAGVLKSKGS